MKKTSLRLGEAEVLRLRRIAIQEGRSQAEVVRAAIQAHEARTAPDRNFAMAGAWEGGGTSVADIAEEELLRGIGNV